MGKGSNTSSSSSTSYTRADPQAEAAYRSILQRAEGVAATPYQAYSGPLTAFGNAQQNLGLGTANMAAGYANPYINQAAGLVGSSVAPVSGGDISQYYDPYQQRVIDSTTANLQSQFGQQQAALRGNNIAQGALGGTGARVGQAILGGQQAKTLASTVAGLQSQGYQSALQAAQADKNRGITGANALAQYGLGGQNAALQAAQLQYGLGTQQQATSQADLERMYQQYAQAQAYPYQQAQWLAGMATGVGSNLGGTSSSAGTQTGPAPNQSAQWLGAGLSAASLFLSDREAKKDISRIGELDDGTPIYRYRYKGDDQWHIGPMAQEVEQDNVVRGVDGMRYMDLKGVTDDAIEERARGGGVGGAEPWGAAGVGWIPPIGIHGGPGAPQSSSAGGGGGGGGSGSGAMDPSKLAAGITDVGGKVRDRWFGGAGDGIGDGSWYGPSSVGGAPLAGYEASLPMFTGVGAQPYASGGGVSVMEDPNQPVAMFGEDDGPSFDERFSGMPRVMPSPNVPVAEMGETASPGQLASFGSVNPGEPVRMHGSTFGPDGPPEPMQTAEAEPEVAPSGVAGRTGGAYKPPVMAYDDEGADPYYAAPDAVAPQKRGFGVGLLSPNAQTGLLAAGLGMMASRSPFLGTAVGEGGLAGVGAYGAAEERDRRIASEAQKLAQEARKERFKSRMDIRKQDETERHNRAAEAKEARDRLPPGMAVNSKGELVNAPGYISAMEARTKAKAVGATMDDETADFLANRVMAGDTKALVGLGRGAQGAENLAKINGIVARKAKAGEAVSDAARNILQNAAQQQGLIAAERTQANIMAKLSVYGRTAFNATDIALELSKAVPRTDFQPVNKILNAAKTKTGDPKIVALGQALMTLTNEYARAIGGGHGTVHDKEAAEKRLSEAQSHAQLEAVINVMRREILAEEAAMPAARKHIRDIYNPSASGPHGTSIAGEHGAAPPRGPVGGASGLPPDGTRGTKNGRPVIMKGGQPVYVDTGEVAR